MIGREIGRFKVVSLLGQGGMASVWKAEDRLLLRPVALKILSPELCRSPKARRRFLHEARTASSLDHPGIVAIHDSGGDEDLVYIALALIDGETVSTLAARGPMAPREAARIGMEAARALAHAHDHGVVHRDVTGRNVMVSRDGRAYVLDFGLALAAGTTRLTSSGNMVGTVCYLSPEGARSEEMDTRSDVYSLGVVLYEAVTGTLPFTGQIASVIYSTINMEPESPRSRRPDLPLDLERIILKAMMKQRELRYQRMSELADALATVLDVSEDQSPRRRRPSPEPAPDAPPADAASSWRPPEHPVVAVLPFESLVIGEDEAEERSAFALGFAEALSAALGAVPELRVVPPSISRPVQEEENDLGKLARRMSANLILRGTLRWSGFQVRASYSLLDPYRRLQVAGGTVDGSRHELFDLEDRLRAAC